MRLAHTYAIHGPDHTGDAELVALALGARGATTRSLELASRLLTRFGGLEGLALSNPQELTRVDGLGPQQAVRLHAALQAGRRSLRPGAPLQPVRTPDEAWSLLAPGLRGLVDEELHALYLNRRRLVVGHRCLTRGSDAFTVVDPRQIFREAVALRATGVILAHNHPSGDPTPSAQDRDVTRRVASAGRVLGIQLVDHLVIADAGWTSFAETGELPAWRAEPAAWVADPSSASPVG